MLRSFSLFVVLAVLWLLLSGSFTLEKPLIAMFGVASCLLTVWIARRMDLIDAEAVPYELGGNILAYWSWLFREIAKANVAVARAALSDLSEVRPRMVEIESSQTSEVGRVIFANSITLTPGTVTVDIADQRMLIHALTESASDPDALKDMDRRVTRLEG